MECISSQKLNGCININVNYNIRSRSRITLIFIEKYGVISALRLNDDLGVYKW